MLRQVEPAMHGGDERRGLTREDREREVVEMEMQDVELTGAAANLLQHRYVQRHGVAHRIVQPQRTRPHWLELGRWLRVAAGEHRDIVAEFPALLGTQRNDALRAPVSVRW